MIDQKRLLNRFIRYVECASESQHERPMCLLLEEELTRLGIPFVRDEKAGEACQSDGWNLQVFLPGEGEPILLSAHMDTVVPGVGIRAVVEDGVIRSAGDTVLGSDDKSGVAAIMEALECAVEEEHPHRPVEVLFSICEEQGLRGSQHADFSRYQSQEAVVMDSSKRGCITNRSTDNATISVTIHGRSAHAANAPESGIHALKAAAQAVANIPCGHVDQVTVVNVANFQSLSKANVVPDLATFDVMIRSFDTEYQQHWFRFVEDQVKQACEAFGASYDWKVKKSYKGLRVREDIPIVDKLRTVYRELGVELKLTSSYGGCDATWIAAQGIDVVNLGTGMSQVHSTEEFIRIEDLVLTAKAAYGLITK